MDKLWDKHPQTMNLLYPQGKSTPGEISALYVLLGPTRVGSAARSPEIESRKSTEVIFLTSQMQIAALCYD
jgi:hypothetical protein